MNLAQRIFTNFRFSQQISLTIFCTEFHEYSVKGLVAYTRPRRDGRGLHVKHFPLKYRLKDKVFSLIS